NDTRQVIHIGKARSDQIVDFPIHILDAFACARLNLLPDLLGSALVRSPSDCRAWQNQNSEEGQHQSCPDRHAAVPLLPFLHPTLHLVLMYYQALLGAVDLYAMHVHGSANAKRTLRSSATSFAPWKPSRHSIPP